MAFYEVLTDLIAGGILFQRYRALFLKKIKLKILLSNQMVATRRHQKVCSDAIIHSVSPLKYSFYVYWSRKTKLLSSRQYDCHNTTRSSLTASLNASLEKVFHLPTLGSISQKLVLRLYFWNSCIFDEHMYKQ